MNNKSNLTLDQALQLYVDGVQKKLNDYWTESKYTFAPTPKAEVEKGRRYIKITVVNSKKDGRFDSRHVHTFIDTTNGNVLKAASWKAPELRNPRGNIYAPDNGLNGVTEHGAVYMRNF